MNAQIWITGHIILLTTGVDFTCKTGSNYLWVYLICRFICVRHNHFLKSRYSVVMSIHSIASQHWNTSVIPKCSHFDGYLYMFCIFLRIEDKNKTHYVSYITASTTKNTVQYKAYSFKCDSPQCQSQETHIRNKSTFHDQLLLINLSLLTSVGMAIVNDAGVSK